MGIFNTTKINFGALTSLDWPEAGSFIFGFDVADDVFKKIDSNGVITVIGSTGSTDSYTTGATLNGNIIEFNNNVQGLNYYNVDLTPLFTGVTGNTSVWTASTGSGSAVLSGSSSLASGNTSHAEGEGTTAFGNTSHAECYYAVTIGYSSHAEGQNTTAIGNVSHVEGESCISSGNTSHAEGQYSTSSGDVSHAEGNATTAIGNYSHSGGDTTIARGINSFVHGHNSTVNGNNSIVLGENITGEANNTTYVENLVAKITAVPTSSADTIGEEGSIAFDGTNFYWKSGGQWLKTVGSTF